jgi:chromosome segregation ATPase
LFFFFSLIEIIIELMKSGPASRHEALREREELIARRAAHEAEVKRLDGEIREKKDSCKQHKQRIQELDQQLDALDDDSATIRNYFDRFEWSDRLMEQLRRVFGIDNFRLAQEGCVVFLLSRRPEPSQTVERPSSWEQSL